jgi:2,5-diamino-6-(ribosylamino)-4(3H)-pyrimidinone 5'-phosphate reductase
LKKPFVFINSAMSVDGKISSIEHTQVRISGQKDMARVDALRANCDAIMVGVGTVLADDPSLRVKSVNLRKARREKGWSEDPLRLVADSMARTPPTAKILGPGCMIATTHIAPQERVEKLMPGCEIIKCGEDRVDLNGLMSLLSERGVKRLMVEGGANLNWSMIKLGLVDEIFIYVGGLIIGGRHAPTLIDGEGFRTDFPQLKLCFAEPLDEGVLLKWKLPENQSYKITK